VGAKKKFQQNQREKREVRRGVGSQKVNRLTLTNIERRSKMVEKSQTQTGLDKSSESSSNRGGVGRLGSKEGNSVMGEGKKFSGKWKG